MSLSRNLRVLVIEDESPMIAAYRGAFKLLKEDGYQIADVAYAGGYDEAVELISSPHPFHLVILDIKLPKEAGGDPESFGRSGLDLIDLLEGRHHSPIPSLLILTGQPRHITRISDLAVRITEGFYYSKAAQKGPMNVPDDIRDALDGALRYVDFGIQATDDRDRPRPPLTPRETDLLRRHSLSNPDHVALTLRWWGSEEKDYGAPDAPPVWSKVLYGRFLMRDRRLFSRAFFFKLESKENGSFSAAGARLLAEMSRHTQFAGHRTCENRSLVVTSQASGDHSHDPISLETFLVRPWEEVEPYLDSIARDIAEGVDFGETSKSLERTSGLLSSLHWDRVIHYDEYWDRKSSEPELAPSTVMGSLDGESWVHWRSCLHGDLHMGNLALGEEGDSIRARVIDPGSMAGGPCGRDLAVLEVSLVLHQATPKESIFSSCRELFNGTSPEGLELVTEGSDVVRNTVNLLSRIRRLALVRTPLKDYRILLLDYALHQIGALQWGGSGNKIFREEDAVRLYSAIVRWIASESNVAESTVSC